MKTTNKILLAVYVVILLVILSGVIVLKIKINKGVTVTTNQIEQKREISKFTSVEAKNRFAIFYTPDTIATLRIKADSGFMGLIKTEVKDGKLILDLTKNLENQNKIEIYITSDSLNEVSLSEDCDFTNKKQMNVSSFKLGCNIRSTLNINGNFKYMKLFMHLQSKGTIKGNCRDFEFEGLGTNLEADEFVVKNCNINVKYGGQSNINVTDELTVMAGSGSMITYAGNPVMKGVDISGNAQLTKKKW